MYLPFERKPVEDGRLIEYVAAVVCFTCKMYLVTGINISIGVDFYTFVGARAPTMLSWAPPKVLWAPTTKVGTGITVTVL